MLFLRFVRDPEMCLKSCGSLFVCLFVCLGTSGVLFGHFQNEAEKDDNKIKKM